MDAFALAAALFLSVSLGCARAVHVSSEGPCILSADDLARTSSAIERVATEYGMSRAPTRAPGIERSSQPKIYQVYEGRHDEGYTKMTVQLTNWPRRVSVRVEEKSSSFDSNHSSELRAALVRELAGSMGRCDVRIGLELAQAESPSRPPERHAAR